MVKVVPMFWCMILFGCGFDVGEIAPKATERVFREGRVYVLNNIRPDRIFYITYEGQKFDTPHNMTLQREPTLQGAVLITPDPLPGGTEVDFEYWVEEWGDVVQRKLSAFLGGPVVIDGDLTIEFYESDWDFFGGIVIPKVFPGKHDAPHIYR
jgi:hypothetical protein